MASSTFFLNTSVSPSTFVSKPSKSNTKTHFHPTRTHKLRGRGNGNYSTCRAAAAAASASSWIKDFDLYELLGVESSSDQLQIKKAYRALQKRCHPDIAGPAGHDMAIILNEVYSLLSDPNSRSAYDQEQAKLSEFRGYTGKPLYSTWFGSENEHRAVFVDEVKCVGCLKCALYANKTFAIESTYGRARVIAQWADPEDKILDAIQTCPVDCISMIERSDLAALEFLMSKQPRGNVRMTGGGNTGGVRVSNIFAEVNKFQSRFEEMRDKASRKDPKESDLQRESRNSAVQGIRSFSNWWYWQSPSQASEAEMNLKLNLKLTHIPKKSTQPNTEKLQEAVAKLKSRENEKHGKIPSMSYRNSEEYWTPMLTLPSPSNTSSSATSSSKPSANAVPEDSENDIRSDNTVTKSKWNITSLRIPFAMAVISAVTVARRGAETTGHGLNEHVGGSMALEVVNSFEMQVALAGITWFVIGMGIVGMFEVLGSKRLFRRQ